MANTSQAETQRLHAAATRTGDWKRWGTYLPERQWGTVREDYSASGDSWRSFTHEDAVSRAYRWGIDGLLGWTDRKCRLAFSIALWNGKDPMLKERLFGLTNPEGNHGEDVKELYYYLDATPTHSYASALYKYPLAEFPYTELRDENARRGLLDPEYEVLDTGVFDDSHYADVQVDYAKAGPNDTAMRVRVTNRSAEPTRLAVLGQLVFRNTWRWGCKHEGCTPRPTMRLESENQRVETFHTELGGFSFAADESPEWLFTENETNSKKLFGAANSTPYTKDAFHDYVIAGDTAVVNPKQRGTKCAALHWLDLKPGESRELRFRLHANEDAPQEVFGTGFEETFASRHEEADAFYAERFPTVTDAEEQRLHRQAMAGLLWTKQFYHYSVYDWIEGDPETPAPPAGRGDIRNGEWKHLFCRDVLSMPDKWEYPWFAAWDTAFHMIPFAEIDPHFTRNQLLLFLREWYLHPNGQLPAYEFNFSDVNPPVHAWACREVYRCLEADGQKDLDFLEQSFHKLLLNFTWWVNRKDPQGNNIFGGGFLGLDNIGPFDRSHPPEGMESLEQADGTAWMAFNCGVMLDTALELARHRPAYDGIASKFFEHFMMIADAMNHIDGTGLWDEEDGFYYDRLLCSGTVRPLPVRSIVGLIPLFAAVIIEDELIEQLAGFRNRSKWFLENRRDIFQEISWRGEDEGTRTHLLAIPTRERLERVLRYVFDEDEFLSPFGIRSMSKHHAKHPFEMVSGGETHRVEYLPGESDSPLFGGNSNWRGPIWFPINYLLIESLRTYDRFYGDSFQVEVPTRSGNWMTLGEAADIS
ncbi:MAG: glucosidase [Planctomycetota bacterium]